MVGDLAARGQDAGPTRPGNHTAIGSGKVSHIWSLRDGRPAADVQDPWLPLDQSYEMCGPQRGRFKAVNLSASGSFVFVIGPHGDLFTRLYDFDLSGHDAVFFHYSYEDQRGKGDGAPIQLPAAPWVRQPKIPAARSPRRSRSTRSAPTPCTGSSGSRASAAPDRLLGARRRVAARAGGWRFHATGAPLTRKRLRNHLRARLSAGRGRALPDAGRRHDRRPARLQPRTARPRTCAYARTGRCATAPAHGRRAAPAGARRAASTTPRASSTAPSRSRPGSSPT